MREQVENHIALVGTRTHNALYALEGLLGVAAGHVLLHAIEDLLDIYPDVSGTDRVSFAAFKILSYNTVNFLVVATKNLWNVRVFRLDVEHGVALCVVQ